MMNACPIHIMGKQNSSLKKMGEVREKENRQCRETSVKFSAVVTGNAK